MKQVNDAGCRVFMGTLTGGVAVHAALADLARQHSVQTAVFQLLGGLHAATFTAYDFVNQVRLPPIELQRPLEIVSGHGTISLLDGQPHVHLHLSVTFRDDAYPHGSGMVGGHVAAASAFAIEYTLTAYDGVAMQRQLDAETGLLLWG